MALEALYETRREAPLTLMLETYNHMLKHSLLPNIKTYSLLILALTDRDNEIHKVVTGLELRGKRRERSGRTESLTHSIDGEQINGLRSEDNFGSAMSLFDAVISVNGNNKISMALYNNLLRSCSFHSNVDAAIYVFAQLEKRTDLLPNATTFGHLISVYTNVGDLQGAKEVFDEFKAACQSNRISWVVSGQVSDGQRNLGARGAHLTVWNKIIEAHFRCGQPAGAIGVLEQMMDTKADVAFGPTDIPPPASSTFTQIIAGFCQSGDVQSALTWFEHMLAQTNGEQRSEQSSIIPPRPDQVAWIIMLDNLAIENRLDDLNRIFSILLDTASQKGLEVRAVDRVLVFQSNMRYIETAVTPADAIQKLDFLLDRILLTGYSDPIPLHAAGSRSMMEELTEQYLRWNAPEKALLAIERFVQWHLGHMQSVEAKGALAEPTTSQSHNKMIHIRQLVMYASSQLVYREGLPFNDALRFMRLSDSVGMLPTRAVTPSYLQAYALSKKRGETHGLTVRDWELLLYGATALELPPSEDGPTEPQHITNCEFGGTISLLEDMSKQNVDLEQISGGISQRLAQVISQYGAKDLFSRLDPNYERTLNDRHMNILCGTVGHKSLSNNNTRAREGEHRPVKVDVYHSRFIDEFFPHNPNVSAMMAYSRFEAGVEANMYPIPMTIGRLISALGRLGELHKVRKLYDAAQRVLVTLENDKLRQSQNWFYIENQMIIAYAHAGDLDSAHMHRTRMLQQGGAPTADAYGALIEYVKDTTDDTANALALFQESQMQDVIPNIYLYNNIISKLAKARKADAALELFEQMKANRLVPSSITYGTVIAACARVGDGYSAEVLFSEMTQRRNFKPRIPPYNTMMQFYAHTKPDRERVIYYYESLLKANIPPSGHTYKVRPLQPST
jgi:pentatricopeptide repeat protein